MAPRLGFIGLGNIGLPMARRIAAAGLAPTVHDLAPAPVRTLVACGARAAASAAAVAAASDVIGVCVRDDADLTAVVLGADGILAGAAAGAVIAVHSTVQRSTVLTLGAAAAARGVALVDAAVSGGAMSADDGTLTVMVGGSDDAVARARPLLDCFAGTIVHTGPLGSGCVAKACNQIMQYVAWTAAFEAMELARAAGVDPAVIEQVTGASGVIGASTRRFLGLYRRPAAERAAAPFRAQMRGFVAIGEKDLNAARALAAEYGVALPAAEAALPLLARIYGVEGDDG